MTKRRLTRRRLLATTGSALVAGVAGCTSPSNEPGQRGANGDGVGGGDGDESVYTQVYRQTIDSVVSVQVVTESAQSQGSGFVFRSGSSGAYVATNEHVVEGAVDVQVRFSGSDWREPEITGTDPYSDLAVLRVSNPPEYATPLRLIEGEAVIGENVVALGNPFGLNASVTEGIVSGVNRSLPAPNNFTIPDAIQTDAAVNPGNSGGPLVDLDGRVVGVINSGGGDNIGFAISASLCRRVLPALADGGDYRHSFMGVRLLTVTPAVAEANRLDEPRGVLVTSVRQDGPSDGVLQGSPDQTSNGIPIGGDVIVGMADQDIDTLEELSSFLALRTSPGDTIEMRVIRDGSPTTVDLTLGDRPTV